LPLIQKPNELLFWLTVVVVKFGLLPACRENKVTGCLILTKFRFCRQMLIKVSNITKIIAVGAALTLADRWTDKANRQFLRVGERVENIWIDTT
jgi:hypothetical protein